MDDQGDVPGEHETSHFDEAGCYCAHVETYGIIKVLWTVGGKVAFRPVYIKCIGWGYI